MTLNFEFLVASLLSTQGHNEIKKLNPFLNDFEVKRVFDLVVDAMFHSVRLGQTRRAIVDATDLLNELKGLRVPVAGAETESIQSILPTSFFFSFS
jgi:hypothetical protein